MTRSSRPPTSRRPTASGSLRQSLDEAQTQRSQGAYGPPKGGRRIPMTAQPSVNNVFAGMYNSLPGLVRDMLPLGTTLDSDYDEAGPPEDRRGTASWQDISFVHAIPGD